MAIKRPIALFLLVVTCLSVNAQTPAWQWARNSFTTGTPSHDEGRGVAIDANGNVYATGFFQSSTISFGTDTFTLGGSADVFLAKYDSAGNVLWAKSNIGSGADYANSVAVDPSGNVFITGSFLSSPMIFGNDTLTNVGGDDVFVVKYDGAGNVLWAKSAGGAGGTCSGLSVATDANGNAIIAGIFYTLNFSIGAFTLTNSGGKDAFIAKYDPAGNVLWAKNPIGTGDDTGTSVATDNSGNVFLTGYFNSPTITFDALTLMNPTPGTDLAFLAKYDPAGNMLWVRSSQGSGTTLGQSAATDVSGNCYISGSFSNAIIISFGTLIITNINLSTSDVFIVKYDAAGNELWAISAGGMGNDAGYSMVSDAANNLYVAGSYSVQSTDSITFDTITLPYAPGDPVGPMFIAKHDSSGNVLWAFSLPSGGDDAQAIGIDLSGSLYLGGDYGFSPYILGADTFTLTADEDVLVGKFCIGFINGDTSIHICGGDSALIYGNYETLAGTYYDSLLTISGCDSIHFTVFTVDTGYYINDTTLNICDGEGVIIYGNLENTTGTYYDSLTTVCGMDSVHFTVLTVNPNYSINDTPVDICTGDSALVYGNYENTTGTYYDSLTTINGCDSVHSTVLTVGSVYAVTDSISIVQGDSAYVGGAWQTTAGIYYDTLIATNGCDSIVATTLIVIVGITEHGISNSITLYPNPTAGQLTISNWQLAKTTAVFELYDITGRIIYQYSINNNQSTIDVSDLAKGMYVWQLGEARGKVVIK